MGFPLPYKQRGTLRDQQGAEIESVVPVSIWAATGHSAGTGSRHYDHEGQAPARLYEQLRQPNRHLVVDGRRYNIVDANRHGALPHVQLQLRRQGN